MINRDIINEARFMISQFRAVCITGPRQSGKTTLAKALFKNKPYISFENPQTHAEAETDIALFLKKYKSGAILDEVQREPLVFRQLQGMLDKNTKRGQFILTGSNNFLMQESISQSLAGRAGYIELLPLSFAELEKAKLTDGDVQAHIFKGGYPEIWNENIAASKWLQAYIQTYLQRDVRMLKNITNLAVFTRFIFICAHYAGKIINREDIARQTGVDTKTVLSWLGVLESSYIIFLLQPWYNNLNKRVIKSPKLYFIDTGVLCNLLGIKSMASLKRYSDYGCIFENWIISEIKKNKANAGLTNGLYYFRDSAGNEVDLITEKNNETFGIEIKSGKKIDRNAMRGLLYWKKNQPASNLILFNGGDKPEQTNEGISLLPWFDVSNF
jgi:predicted AAA+ superfamily ATPase